MADTRDDHYLEVHRAERVHVLRGRMRDALDRVTHLDGVQPHRSWWVAWSVVLKIESRGRDGLLRLTDGSTVPIARGRLKSLETEWKRRNT